MRPGAQRIKSLLLTHAFRPLHNGRRNPFWKWHLPSDVSTGSRVLFMHLRNLSGWISRCHSYERRPKSAVNESDLSIHQSTNEHIFGMGYYLKEREDLVAFRMGPPTPLNRLVYDCLSQPWNWAFGRSENYAVLFDKRDCFIGSHTAPRYDELHSCQAQPHASRLLKLPA
jgi:hypothetical protein